MPTRMAFGPKQNFVSDDPMEKLLGVGGDSPGLQD